MSNLEKNQLKKKSSLAHLVEVYHKDFTNKIVKIKAPTGVGKTRAMIPYLLNFLNDADNKSLIVIVLKENQSGTYLYKELEKCFIGQEKELKKEVFLYHGSSKSDFTSKFEDDEMPRVIITNYYQMTYINHSNSVSTIYHKICKHNFKLFIDEPNQVLSKMTNFNIPLGHLYKPYSYKGVPGFHHYSEKVTEKELKEQNLCYKYDILQPNVHKKFLTFEYKKADDIIGVQWYNLDEKVRKLQLTDTNESELYNLELYRNNKFTIHNDINKLPVYEPTNYDKTSSLEYNGKGLLNSTDYVLKIIPKLEENEERKVNEIQGIFYRPSPLFNLINCASQTMLLGATYSEAVTVMLDEISNYTDKEIIIEDLHEKANKVKGMINVFYSKEKSVSKKFVLDMFKQHESIIYLPTIIQALSFKKYAVDNNYKCGFWKGDGSVEVSEGDIINTNTTLYISSLETENTIGANAKKDFLYSNLKNIVFHLGRVKPDYLYKVINNYKIKDFKEEYSIQQYIQTIGRSMRGDKLELNIVFNGVNEELCKKIVDELKEENTAEVKYLPISKNNTKKVYNNLKWSYFERSDKEKYLTTWFSNQLRTPSYLNFIKEEEPKYLEQMKQELKESYLFNIEWKQEFINEINKLKIENINNNYKHISNELFGKDKIELFDYILDGYSPINQKQYDKLLEFNEVFSVYFKE